MADSLYFYDLETSGLNPREARIMQFAGQRTDLELRPLGEPDNILIRLSEDVLPEPDAILITGITPQQTQAEGITEAEFCKLFESDIAVPGTIFVGYNTIRFDDEFMRYTLYRNFYDAYEWQWKDNRSRWDLLDAVRMTRALRPEGINWPFASDGKASNRLELLTSVNKLDHQNAHDALADVKATIAVAQLLRTKQSKLFDYLLSVRHKKQVSELALGGKPFVYTSGKYPSEFEKTTVVATISENPKKNGVLVYDLRHDPSAFADMSPEQLAEAWKWRPPEEAKNKLRLPIKTMQFNRCPAIAPLSVLDEASQERIKIDPTVIEANRRKLEGIKDWPKRLFGALEILDRAQQERLFSDPLSVDAQLYDNFLPDEDRRLMIKMQSAKAAELNDYQNKYRDDRLKSLLPLYKARNFASSLTSEERTEWEAFKTKRLLDGGQQSRLARYFKRLDELAAQPRLTKNQQYLLEDLRLYGQSLMPTD